MQSKQELTKERMDEVISMINDLDSEDEVIEWIDRQTDKDSIDTFLAGFWGDIVPHARTEVTGDFVLGKDD